MSELIFNADVGEEAGFDEQIMPYVAWCNIACGSHAGNEKVIENTIELALKNNVKIGAHPSYPDRENFGRIEMDLEYDELVKSITEQIELVKYYTEKKGGELHHVKPHGALYNVSVVNEQVAKGVIESINNVDKSLSIITSEKSKIYYLAKDVLRVQREVFADRNYNDDLTLVSRLENDALITDPILVCNHLLKMIQEKVVQVKSGKQISIDFDTICVHGDNPKSVQILKYIHQRFKELNLL